MNTLQFSKYHGAGNDFIIFDFRSSYISSEIFNSNINLVKQLCNRNFGIGADGIILILPASASGLAKMQIFNSDGSIPQMCGNGIRCLIKYIQNNNELEYNTEFLIETLAGNIYCNINDSNEIRINMGEPVFLPPKIPTTLSSNSYGVAQGKIEIDNHLVDMYSAGMGNPHLVVPCQSINDINIEKWGSELEVNINFPEKTNVHFVEIINKNRLQVKVWERGAGLTLACGTGACAVVAVLARLNMCNDTCDVLLPGGTLKISWPNKSGNIYMSGPVQFVFSGRVNI